jgi:glycine betaine/proline transport system substrate-binding protein
MKIMRRVCGAAFSLITWALPLALGLGSADNLALAQGAQPGKGVSVKLTYDSTAETLFQTDVVAIGLEKLGYNVKPIVPLEIPAMYVSAATGDSDLTASAWEPLQDAYFDKAGGTATLERVGKVILGANQGYFVDAKTAAAYNITSIDQLTDPKTAALFSDSGNGKAQLFGCPPGWGCELAIEHQLNVYKLRPTVNHVQGDIAVLASEIISRFKSGKPVLYYTYNPYWVSQVLVAGKDVVQLTVPFTSLPKPTDPKLTTLPDGRNVGFTVNTIEVVGNRRFLESNPAAKKWLSLVTIPLQDVIAENHQIYKGEKTERDIRGHADIWVANHATEVNAWLTEAEKAGSK